MNQTQPAPPRVHPLSLLRCCLLGMMFLGIVLVDPPDCKAQTRRAQRIRQQRKNAQLQQSMRNRDKKSRIFPSALTLKKAEKTPNLLLLEQQNIEHDSPTLIGFGRAHKMVRSAIGEFSFADIAEQRYNIFSMAGEHALKSYGDIQAFVAAAAVHQQIIDTEAIIRSLTDEANATTNAPKQPGDDGKNKTNSACLSLRLDQLVSTLHPGQKLSNRSREAIIAFVNRKESNSDLAAEKELFKIFHADLRVPVHTMLPRIMVALRTDRQTLEDVLSVRPRFSFDRLLEPPPDATRGKTSEEIMARIIASQPKWPDADDQERNTNEASTPRESQEPSAPPPLKPELDTSAASANPISLVNFEEKIKELETAAKRNSVALAVLSLKDSKPDADFFKLEDAICESEALVLAKLRCLLHLQEGIKKHGNEPHEEVLESLSCLFDNQPEPADSFRIDVALQLISVSDLETARKWVPDNLNAEEHRSIKMAFERAILNQIAGDLNGNNSAKGAIDIAELARELVHRKLISGIDFKRRILLAETIYMQAFWLQVIDQMTQSLD